MSFNRAQMMMRTPLRLLVVLGASLVGLIGCDRPGPLSAAARTKPPAPPAWSAALVGKPLASVYPVQIRCLGFVDRSAERFKGARKVVGWAWDASGGRDVQRLVAVDQGGRMVGFGEGGLPRPDVPAAEPRVPSRNTGWWLIIPTKEARYAVYGLHNAVHGACLVGEAKP